MKKLLIFLKDESGFTLLEMSIVILVIAALLLLVIMNVDEVSKSVDDTTGEAMVQTVETQMVLYDINEKEKLSGTPQEKVAKLLADEYITNEQNAAYLDFLAKNAAGDDG